MTEVTKIPDAELLHLFDRFLVLVGDATRRVGRLFPYNHLCRRLQAMLAGSSARVVITDDDGTALAVVDVVWRDGDFHRVDAAGPRMFDWSIPRERLELAAAQPWVFLADPKRLGFAWFANGRRRDPRLGGSASRWYAARGTGAGATNCPSTRAG